MGYQFLVAVQMKGYPEILPLMSAIKYLSSAIEALNDKVDDLSTKIDAMQMLGEFELESSDEEESEEESEEVSDNESVQSAPATFSFKVQRTQ